MKILIFGPNGYMGQHFLSLYPEAMTTTTDIADQLAVHNALEEHTPEIVINCAGKTGVPNVDWCEDHPLETIRSNVAGPLILAEECLKRNIYMVQLSTGCIYEGTNNGKGWSEDDLPNFHGSLYSRAKASADQLLRELDVLQLRLRMPFDGSGNPRCLLTKITQYKKLNAIPNSLTYIPDFLAAAKVLIQKKKTGIYNVVNPGVTSPYDMMLLYKELVDPSREVEAFLHKCDPKLRSKQRSNCVLSTEKLVAEGVRMKPVEKAVREAILEYKNKAKTVTI